jgi:hypothetical protein
MRAYPYVGPEAIRERPRGEPGAAIRSQQELAAWLAAHPEAATEGATFVVDDRGVLRVAPRRSEHIDCAGGGAVLAAGELRFAGSAGRPTVAEATNQSTGYCPEPECWEVVAAKLSAAGIPGPQGWSHAFVFRRCAVCRQINVVKDEWFVCDACDAALPRSWNFA